MSELPQLPELPTASNQQSVLAASVCIVTFDRAGPCIQAIESLDKLFANSPPFEIIVVEQAKRTVEGYCRDKGVKYLFLDQPSMCGARNLALAHAAGEFVLYLDDDIIASPSLINGHLDCYQKDSQIGGVAGRVVEAGAPSGERQPPYNGGPLEEFYRVIFDSRTFEDVPTARGCNMSFRRSFLRQIGGFDRRFKVHRDDSEVSYQIRQLGYRVAFAPEAMLEHFPAPRGGCRARPGRLSYLKSMFHHVRDDALFHCRCFSFADALRQMIGRTYFRNKIKARNPLVHVVFFVGVFAGVIQGVFTQRLRRAVS